MKIRSIGALAVGAAIGYALNTPTGRAQIARLRQAAAGFMGRPEVQAKTADLAEKAKQKAAGLPDPVQNVAKSTIDAAAQRATGQQPGSSQSDSTRSSTSEPGGTGPSPAPPGGTTPAPPPGGTAPSPAPPGGTTPSAPPPGQSGSSAPPTSGIGPGPSTPPPGGTGS